MPKIFAFILILLTFLTNGLDTAYAQDLEDFKKRYEHAKKIDRKLYFLSEYLVYCESEDLKKHNEELRELLEQARKEKSLSSTIIDEHFSYYYNNCGFIAENAGDMKKALSFYNRSLKMAQKIGLERQIATCYQNLSSIYDLQEDYTKALSLSYKSLAIKEKIKDIAGAGRSHNNIAYVFTVTKNYDSSIYHYKKSASLFKELGDKKNYGLVLNNIGYEYLQKDQLDSASYYFDYTLGILNDKNDKQVLIYSYLNLSEVYFRQNHFSKALIFAEKAEKLAKQQGTLIDQRNVYSTLYKIYKAIGQFEKALQTHENYVQAKDSITNDENKAEVYRQEIKHENDKKIIQLKNKQKLKDILNQEKLFWQGLINLIGVLCFLLICTFSFFLFKRFKLTREQNQQISLQKEIIEEKQQEIQDSISYAERIQKSFLASEQSFSKRFSDYFVLFEPKDVVSGDFYWAGEADGLTFICVADSTGHGIPGAFMSLLNISLLNEALYSKALRNPAAILDFVRKILILGLKPDSSGQGGKDGMDCAFVAIDTNNSSLLYTGANNPLWILRQNELLEFKPTKMPVGRSPRENEPFEFQQIALEKGDIIYLFSDGFADQFGGPKGKKYKYKPFADFLKNSSEKGLTQQGKALREEFLTWKSDYEQTDDVCVLAIRI